MFVSAGTDLKFYSCPGEESDFHYSPQHSTKITSLSWSRDNCYLVFLPLESNPEIISLKSNQNVKRIHTITALKDASSVVFQKTTKKSIGIGTNSGQIALYDTKNKGISKLYPSLNAKITCVDFDQKDETMAIASENGTINVLNLSTSTFLNCYKTCDGSAPNIVKYHPLATNILATATEEGGISIWDVNTSQKTFSAQIHTKSVGGLAFGKRNDLFISAGLDRKFCVHDLNIKECIFRGNLHQPLTATDISINDDFIVLGTDEGMIYVYDFRYLLQPLSNWKSHNTEVGQISFAYDIKNDFESKAESSKPFILNKNRKEFENSKSVVNSLTSHNRNSEKKLLFLSDHGVNNNNGVNNLNLFMDDIKLFVKSKTQFINSHIRDQFDTYKKMLLDEFQSLDKGLNSKWNLPFLPHRQTQEEKYYHTKYFINNNNKEEENINDDKSVEINDQS